MAITSRYRKAFQSAAASAAGPPIEVSGFTPGSVTTPAAILKGISMYAKARRDQRASDIASTAADAEAAAAARSQQIDDDYKRAETAKALAPPAPHTATPRQGVDPHQLSPELLQQLGVTPGPDGTIDPVALATASAQYGRTHRPGKTMSAAEQQLHVGALGYRDYMSHDAPLVARHMHVLLGEPIDYGDGKPALPGQESPDDWAKGGRGGYNDAARAVAAQHLGIDFNAWMAHDPSNFPDDTSKGTRNAPAGTTTATSGDRSKDRAAALAWQHNTLQNAVTQFRNEKIKQYGNRYLTSDPAGAPQADDSTPDAASPDPNAQFEQDLMDALNKAAQ